MLLFQTKILVEKVRNILGFQPLFSNLLLVFGNGPDCVQGARELRLGSDSFDGILVEEVIEPGDLADLSLLAALLFGLLKLTYRGKISH